MYVQAIKGDGEPSRTQQEGAGTPGMAPSWELP
jgi:hypothetical protein